MIVVHHLNNSRSQRVLWLLEELGLPYEIVRYERDPKTMLAPKALREVHPLGKSPVLVDDGMTVAESGAIVEYLVGRYGQGRLKPPADSPDSLRYTYFLHYAEGSAMPPLLLKLVFTRMETAPVPFFAKPVARLLAKGGQKAFIDPQIKTHLDYLEGEIGKTGWFAGDDFTAADIQMSFPMEAASARGGLDGTYPKLLAWLGKIHARPAYQAALARGGEYAFASAR
ncbi:glutathione S-transferase [Bacillus sp. NP157]|nr:glutathione S-transferase [Bacillus sp. NP157]